jgi:hypothetical protein
MKKLFILILCILCLNTCLFAREIIPFTVYVDDKTSMGHGSPKSPIRPPVVYIDDYTLSFTADHPEYVLTIRNEESDVVYTTVVSSSETQILLPDSISGTYQITLTMGNWLFIGWVDL